jgi:hypothetical protein
MYVGLVILGILLNVHLLWPHTPCAYVGMNIFYNTQV